MTKKQKIWCGIFLGMFLIIEIFFSQTILSVLYLFGIHLEIFNPINNYIFWLISFIVEIISLSGLLFLNIKFNKSKGKFIFSIVLSLMLLMVLFYLFAIISVSITGLGFF